MCFAAAKRPERIFYMRLRNVRGAREAVESSGYVQQEPEKLKGNWQQVFPAKQPLFIEVGMGKGKFILEMARRYPRHNFVGIEMYDSVLLRALQRRETMEELDNVWFLRMDARELPEVFAPGEADGVYLNFSDPWPKDRHAKRRLTSRQFLDRYLQILKPGGRVQFKTDNKPLFAFSLEELAERGWRTEYCTEDLHGDPEKMVDNVMTEYEEKFSAMGNPICMYIAVRPDLV